MKSKTIILSSQKQFVSNSPRAIVTFISNNNNLEGKIRLYNLSTLPNNSKLGIYYNNQVYTTNLVKKDDVFCFYLNEEFNLDNNIYCAIVDKGNNNDVVLCGGTTNNFNYYIKDDEVEENLEEDDIKEKPNISEEKFSVEEDNKPLNFKESPHIPSKDECDDCKDCENCIYKQYFYSHQNKSNEEVPLKNLQLAENENINNVEINSKTKIHEETASISTTGKESEKFLQSISNQLDDMFKTYPEDKIIMEIIPNSKIIKVTDSFDEHSYIVGVIYEENEIKYLMYGVPSKYNEPVPKEFGENYQWLPLNTEDPMSDGYYLIYQDATSGKIVPIIVE